MKAAILVESKKPLEVVVLKLPDQLAYGQVHVKIHFSGICGAQINEIEAAKGPDKFLPHLLGHEASGTVLRIGPGVKTVKPNDRVVLHWRPSAGIQSEAPKYDWNGRTVNAGWVTTFNEEAFMENIESPQADVVYGHIFPLNFIKIEPLVEHKRNRNLLHVSLRKMLEKLTARSS